jgi:hypothetical protein
VALTVVGLAVTAWLHALLRRAGLPELVWHAGSLPSVVVAVVAGTVGALVAGQLLGQDSSLVVAAATLAVAAIFQPAQAHLWLRPRT